jgi:pimeloyl-ACP methyl ester carboxylesterase
MDISKYATTYKSIDVDRLSIFYREAGSPDAPTLLLLHGFPSSSRMYEPLFTRLGDDFHLVAPDYPGFGHSDAPDPTAFDYTFHNVARIIERFTELVRLDRYSLFVQDYGGPVGFRLAVAHPDRLDALVIQNAVAHEDGLGHSGKRVVISGLTVPPTKPLSGRTSCPWLPPGSGIWDPARMYPCTTQTSGLTSSHS